VFSRLGEASLLPFDADLGEVSLGLAAAGVVLATAALLLGLRTRRQWAAQGRTAGAPHPPGPATAAPGPAVGPVPGAGPAAGPVPDGYAAAVGDQPPAGAAPADPRPAPPDRSPAARAPVPPTARPDAASSAAFAVAARRDITLLDRQLRALDELERTETDPDTLQRLFLLDNLAMRLRRGAESLLVLAGSPPARRVRESTAVSDVVRTASSQIESYERVRVDLTDDPPLAAVHVVPLAHLLAELLENATVFSAPDTIVDVLGHCDADALHLVVRDAGLGLSAEDLARAEATVRAGDRDPASGERLGLAVVGRLAARLGVGVTFAARADAAGTDVTVRLPRALFDVEGPDEVAAEPDDTAVLPEPEYRPLPVATGPGFGTGPAGDAPAEEAYVPLVPPGAGEPLVPRQERGAFATDPLPRPAPGPRRTAGGPRAADLPPVPDLALPSFDAILSGETPVPGGLGGPNGLGGPGALGAPGGPAPGDATGHPPDAPPGHPPDGAPDAAGPRGAAHATGPAPGHPNGRAHGGHAADRAPGRGRGRPRGVRASARSAARAAGHDAPTAPIAGVDGPGGPVEVFYPDPGPGPGPGPGAGPGPAPAAGPGTPGPFVPDGPFLPGPSAPGASGPAAPDAAAPTPGGGLALDAHASFAERASLQRQALAELSSISSYRPQASDTGAAGSLTRRTPAATAAVADAPEDAIVRDAEALRARLTAFRAGTARGTQDGVAADPLAVTHLTSVAEEAR
jgi:hypothetical protein